ncbi:MAG: tetratricopeptide repeat protein [Trueperaceae bacterium]|nr:tetratricopeptide repeat protein [Trueperaceae bacterium]
MVRKFGFGCLVTVLMGLSLSFAQTADNYYQMALKTLNKARADQAQGVASEGLWRSVINSSEMALSKDNSMSKVFPLLAEAYETLGLQSQAWKYWQYAWLESNDPVALTKAKSLGYQLAEASLGAGLLEAAEKYYLALLDLDAKDGRIYYGLAKIASQQNKLAEAKHYWQVLLSLEPDNQEALSALSILQDSLAQPEKTLYQNAETLSSPADLEALYSAEAVASYRAALTLYDEGKAYEARLKFIQAVELAPEFKEAWVWVGRTRLEQDSIPLAIQAFKKALALDPNNAGIQEQLAKAQARR